MEEPCSVAVRAITDVAAVKTSILLLSPMQKSRTVVCPASLPTLLAAAAAQSSQVVVVVVLALLLGAGLRTAAAAVAPAALVVAAAHYLVMKRSGRQLRLRCTFLWAIGMGKSLPSSAAAAAAAPAPHLMRRGCPTLVAGHPRVLQLPVTLHHHQAARKLHHHHWRPP